MLSVAPAEKLDRLPHDAEAATVEPRAAAAAERRSGGDRRGPLRPNRLSATRERMDGALVTRTFQAADLAGMAAASMVMGALGGDPMLQTTSIVATVGAAACLAVMGAYVFGRRHGLVFHLARLAVCFGLAMLAATLALTLAFPLDAAWSAVAAWAPLPFVGLCAMHATWWALVRRWRRNGRLTPNIIVVGATSSADRMIASLLETRDANVLGVFDDRASRAPRTLRGVPVLGDVEKLLQHRALPYADRIVITVPSRARARVRQLIERLRVLPNEITLLLDGDDQDQAAAIARIADVPLARISGPPTGRMRHVVKRAQDIVVASVAVVLAAPLMAGLAVLIKLDSPGPVLFRQRRHGFNNEEIVVWKFRSMRAEAADPTASRQVTYDDPRVTRVGRFIRLTSLDELPQLFNVLKGEMSLVGPRPHAVGMKTGDVESARLVAEYAHRHRMKPGMTGWAAIHGSRGPVDTAALVRRRVALDVEYIERQSFWLDLYIMAMTIPCLLGDRYATR